MARSYNYDIMAEMQRRYALKHFAKTPVTREALLPVFEAARYAPSCYNEQPERFILGDTPERHEKLASCLVPGNAYAKEAPVLILVLTSTKFKLNGKDNPFAKFDAGQAAAFLQLEAVRRGFGVHCIAGFDAQRARELFAIPEDLATLCMIALGYPAPLDTLTPEERAKEAPGERNPLESFIFGE